MHRDIAIIVAMADEGVIGKDGDLPWGRTLPKDLRRFHNLTAGNCVIMGRRTWESIPLSRTGKKLPDRLKIVLSRTNPFSVYDRNTRTAHSFQDALALARQRTTRIFVIGGAHLFEEALPYTRYLYITHIHARIAGDTYFPAWSRNDWDIVHKESIPQTNQDRYATTFAVYQHR